MPTSTAVWLRKKNSGRIAAGPRALPKALADGGYVPAPENR